MLRNLKKFFRGTMSHMLSHNYSLIFKRHYQLISCHKFAKLQNCKKLNFATGLMKSEFIRKANLDLSFVL